MKPNPETYLEAAELIDDYREHFMCFAIDRVRNKDNPDWKPHRTPVDDPYNPIYTNIEVQELNKYIKPLDARVQSPWGYLWGKEDYINAKTARDCRVIALLFMYKLTSDQSYHDPKDTI